MTTVYFKKNGICYYYDDTATASVPPPGAVIVNSVGTTYTDCENCCPAPDTCPYGSPSEGDDELTATFSLKETLCEDSTYLLFSGSTTLTRTPTTGYVPQNCTWTGTIKDQSGNVEATVSLKLEGVGDDGEWTLSVTIPSTVSRTYSATKKNDETPVGDYDDVIEACSSADSVAGLGTRKVLFTDISVAVAD